MNQNQISPDDPRLTLYALGEMEPSEQAGFEKLLERDPVARQVVAEIRAMAATVTAALEHEPADAAAKPAGKVLRFPQAYFMISGLAAACFAVFFVLWQNQHELKRQSHLIEVPLAPAAESANQDASAKVAITGEPVAVPPPVVTIGRIEPSPTEAAPSQNTFSGTGGARADVATAQVEADGLLTREEARNKKEISADKRDAAERYATAAAKQKSRALTDSPAPLEETIHLDAFTVAASPAAKRAPVTGVMGFVAGKPLPKGGLSRQLYADSEAYGYHKDNGYLRVADQPLSTFSIDVDTASYANVRRFLGEHQRPPVDAVRVEELVNYFPYDYTPPAGDQPFAANLEVAAAPWAPEHRLVRIGLKGREISEAQRPAANLVFLLDVSGSMNEPNKLPLVKQSLRLLVEKLRPDDRVAIAVYAGASGLALPSTSAREKAKILDAIDQLDADGSTNGAMGIQLAYDIAKANFVAGGVNRVILATDGDFNVGTTSEGELVRLIEEKAKSGVFLSVLGFGMGNLKDSTLEQLADKGNGNYAYIDSLAEAKKTLVEQAGGTLVTIAKDVKIQVEFNPAQVQAYRLIGYENRLLAKEDFNNDKVDAGEIGAGHTVTALYEVVPVGAAAPSDTPAVDGLKYQTVKAADARQSPVSGELLTVKIAYKEPTGDVSSKLEFPLIDQGAAFADASGDFKFAAAVAGFGMALRDSPYKGQLTLANVLEWGRAGLGQDVGGYRSQFLTLVNAADLLMR
jgi:Ca-activated chloride channel family protein